MAFDYSSIFWTRSPVRLIGIGSFCLLSLYAPAAHADRTDRIRVLLHQGRGERAMELCRDWEAHESDSPERLREACAQAAWQEMEISDSYVGWAEYRETWAGTRWGDLAIEREASARLLILDTESSEAELREIAENYVDTDSAEAYRAVVGEAAYREIESAEDAVRVARMWPTYLWDLLRRYPVDFVDVSVDGRRVSVELREEFGELVSTDDAAHSLSEHEIEFSFRWLAVNDGEEVADWDTTVVGILETWGVRHEVTSALPVDTGEALLPICAISDPPNGWRPVIEVSIDEARFLHPVEPDADCSESTWPVFVSREDGRAIGISLRPGHRLDLRSDERVSDIRGLVRGAAIGDVVLGPDGIYQQYAAIQVVQPLSGGAPWTTLRSAGQWAQPLGSSLYLDPIPEGWEIVPVNGELQARSEILARMPLALRQWNLIAGEISVVPLQMRAVIGLTTDRASPEVSPAPRMTAQSGWIRTANGGVESSPPEGASVAGIYEMSETERQVAIGILAAMSLTDESLFVIDGWRVDLDNDRVEESVLRASIEGNGVVFVLDPLVGDRPLSADNVRVFGWEGARVGGEFEFSTPFPFRKEEATYLAWSSVDENGLSMEVLRSDGTGFVSDRFDLAFID